MVAAGVDTMVECGSRAALIGMIRRIAPEVRTATVTDAASLEGAVSLLAAPARASV
jgi:hypothetical protein